MFYKTWTQSMFFESSPVRSGPCFTTCREHDRLCCSCSKLLKLVISNRINDTKKLLCICCRFKCLLVKVVRLNRYHFVFMWPEEL